MKKINILFLTLILTSYSNVVFADHCKSGLHHAQNRSCLTLDQVMRILKIGGGGCGKGAACTGSVANKLKLPQQSYIKLPQQDYSMFPQQQLKQLGINNIKEFKAVQPLLKLDNQAISARINMPMK